MPNDPIKAFIYPGGGRYETVGVSPAVSVTAAPKRAWRLFCPECDYRGEDDTAQKPDCPYCGTRMHIDRDAL